MNYDEIKSETAVDDMARWRKTARWSCVLNMVMVVVAGVLCCVFTDIIAVIASTTILMFLLFFAVNCYARKNYMICWRLREAYAYKRTVLQVAECLKLPPVKEVMNCAIDTNEQVKLVNAIAQLLRQEVVACGCIDGVEQSKQSDENRQNVSGVKLCGGMPQIVVNNHCVENGVCHQNNDKYSVNIQQILSALPKPITKLTADYKLMEAIIEMLAKDPSKDICQ